MDGVKEIRNKIISIKNTQKVTKAMEMVAASKMRKSNERMLASRPYVETIRQVICNITLGNLEYQHPYIKERDIKNIGYFVVSTDRGLAGSININLFKKLLIDIQNWQMKGIEIQLALIGCKAVSFFNLIGTKVVAQITGITEVPKLTELIGLVKVMLQAYDEEHLDRIYIVYNTFISTISQVPKILQILPIKIDKKIDLQMKYWDYIYESDPKKLLEIIISRYIESQIYQSVIENIASEQAARMIAMKAATDNGNSIIQHLQLIYNKARQNSITQEITEIINGAAAV
ncbi:F0F1 ATP synthase subunit gamma [Candidatus Palibaumannia cicadellinicola]|uniref:ATP synthase gamma chain n=1 Tax=Candidatus Palibaumannia cicadellinicola TaxID=186490 RepID=A0A0K2BK78_9GAMM|nr:F0F1 ATP synthase subunit gamma [Candidatus Baumannia cicadellinicola]AKZ65740.1 ATP synthase gamma chain [Candidatus Baumannia cicadellinicola]